MLKLFDEHRNWIEAEAGRAAGSVLRVHALLQKQPVATSSLLVEATGLTRPTIMSALEVLQNMGIVHEASGRGRDRVYVYTDYLDILSKGTEPLQ